MSDPQHFMPQALAQVQAEQILMTLSEAGRESLLLWKAYLKRIRPVPEHVYDEVAETFIKAVEAAVVAFENAEAAALAMDITGDALWNALDEQAQYAWLLKAV